MDRHCYIFGFKKSIGTLICHRSLISDMLGPKESVRVSLIFHTSGVNQIFFRFLDLI